MEPIAFVRRATIGLLGTALSAAMLAATARGSELQASASGLHFTLHSPEETLRDACVAEDGRLWLVIPGGSRHELVTSVTDPAILNPGDGCFHPFDEAQVRAALAALRCSIGDVSADVYLLPYPRGDGLESAAGERLILLSPGVRPLTPEHQQAEFIHELGHVVQYARMPDADRIGWARYRQLRGIADASIYNASAPHADRPHEIFAEDFRALFGGPLAQYPGTIENPTLAPPASVPGLSQFILDLTGGAGAASDRPLACYPNPSTASVNFARESAVAVPLDLFDLTGRRVSTIEPTATAGGMTWRWDGRDRFGAALGPGVFFARARDDVRTLRVTRVR